MLAALLATRSNIPVPVVLNYGNQFIAAKTTFDIVVIVRRAAFITTSLPIRQQLMLTLPGRESVFNMFSRMYRDLCSQKAADEPAYLNDTIIQTINFAVTLTGILQTLPVASQNTRFLTNLQDRLAIALTRLRSLGRLVPPFISEWTDERDAYG